jgi:hypothetical protein
MSSHSRAQRHWSPYDDEALLALAAMTLSDLRSGDAKRQHGAREELQELQTELRRRGVWGNHKEVPTETRTTPDADEPAH